MGNSNATVSATETTKPAAGLLTDRAAALQKNSENPPRAAARRSGSLLRRNASIRSSLRKNRAAGLHAARRTNFLLRRNKKIAPPRRVPLTPDERELLAAAGRGDLDIVLETLRSGVGLDTTDANEMTGLHHAAKHARDDVVRCLVDRGADVNATDLTGGFSPLHWVIINSCPPVGSTNHVDETIIALARSGGNVNATDFNLATPLHIAAQKGHRSTIDTLVRLGANPLARDVIGRSCLEVAKSDGVRDFIRSLHNKKESVVYHTLEVPDDSAVYHTLEAPDNKETVVYHVLEVTPTSSSRSPSPPPLPEPTKKPRLSSINISRDTTSNPTTSTDSALFRNLPRFQRRQFDSPGYPAPPPPQSPSPHSRNSTPEYSVVNVPLPYKYRPLPLPPVQVPSPLYRYSAAYSSPVPPPPHAIPQRRASRKFSNASSRPHRFH